MTGPAPARAPSPLTFILLVVALSIPFWLLGAFAPRDLLPGSPIAALSAACPALAAAFLCYRENGLAGARALFSRAYDFRRIGAPMWYAAIFLIMPAIMIVAYLLMQALGRQLPAPTFDVFRAAALFAAFFFFALGEELGWSGYAIDPLQQRFGALRAALLLGAVWAAWHVIALFQAGRTLEWIAWWTLGTMALRVLTVWIYNNTGKSVFAAALFHADCNLSWQLFPVSGSHYDPHIIAPLEAAVALIVVLVSSPRTLTRVRTR